MAVAAASLAATDADAKRAGGPGVAGAEAVAEEMPSGGEAVPFGYTSLLPEKTSPVPQRIIEWR